MKKNPGFYTSAVLIGLPLLAALIVNIIPSPSGSALFKSDGQNIIKDIYNYQDLYKAETLDEMRKQRNEEEKGEDEIDERGGRIPARKFINNI
jgi:hypothetical protein